MICHPHAVYAESRYAKCWRTQPSLFVKTWSVAERVSEPRHVVYIMIRRGVCVELDDIEMSLDRYEYELLRAYLQYRHSYKYVYNILTPFAAYCNDECDAVDKIVNAVAMDCSEQYCYIVIAYNTIWAAERIW
ncbi:MAG: hypothetical protein QXT13_11770 [Pyrobaculum sp.]